MPDKKLRIGTSGWHYGHWIGPFYPEGTPKKNLLEYYSTRFDSVEINNSFYRLPEESTFLAWRRTVPEDFLFSVKASRLITHNKKLKDPGATVPPLMERAVALKEKLGPILFQLPPSWKLNLERLREFLSALPGGFKYAFELRNHEWFVPEVYDALKRHNAALCIFDLDYFQSPVEVTADFVYMRLHGPDGSYRGSYPEGTLREWAGRIKKWRRDGKEVYCYFDNDEAGYAAQNALKLKELTK